MMENVCTKTGHVAHREVYIKILKEKILHVLNVNQQTCLARYQKSASGKGEV